jgi:hypothetical protein
MCSDLGAPGAIVWASALGAAAVSQTIDVAVDASGNPLVAQGRTPGNVALGVSKLSPDGRPVYTVPFGSLVAANADGHATIAGPLTAPIVIGGDTLVPEGNVDVFVAELDATGRVVFARALGLCGDGLSGLAVDRSGRIALSGDALGTIVLDPDGLLVLHVPYSGRVAFDQRGDLVVAGSFTALDLGGGTVASQGARDGFVVDLDAAGHVRWSQTFASTEPTGTVDLHALALDRAGNVIAGGVFDPTIDLFGTILHTISAPEAGIVFDTFLVKLDASGDPVWIQPAGPAPARDLNAAATDAAGAVLASGADTGNAGFFRITNLGKLAGDASGIWDDAMIPASGYGEGLGVATDACGAVYWGVTALDTPAPSTPLRAYLVKLAP